MKLRKHKITLKILIGYIILGVSSAFFGFLVLSEIKTLTELQGEGFIDKNKILNVGGLIADIYENENLARAAIELNSSKKFNQYLKENERLLTKIDSLHSFSNNASQEVVFDSIKVILNKKLKNIVGLKRVKGSYNSDESINTVIDKLTSIDSLVSKTYVDNSIKKNEFSDLKSRGSYRKLKKMLEERSSKDTLGVEQVKIDSLLSTSKVMLEKTQKEADSKRMSLLRKERQLIGNDLIISRKLKELLHILKAGIIKDAHEINEQREKTVKKSRKIILSAAIISLLIIVVFSIIFLNDFWKNQRYREELEGANNKTSSLLKSREQLISMVSHDLRTPLSTISGYSELLQKSPYDVKEKNYIEHISNASAYMNELVNDLMEFSKVESGAVSFKPVPFDLEKSIDEIILSSQNFIDHKPVELKVKHDKNIKNPIISDPFKIKQILNNLITNACKFTNEGSIVVQTTLFPKGIEVFLEISVQDTGIGIPTNEQETIFKEFTQVENTKESHKNGFGLGLTISKKLAELLRGKLTLKSEEGKGSLFTLRLPVKLSKKPLSSFQVVKQLSVFNLTAIVVEDDASMRQLISDILDQYNIKSYIFNDAQQALASIDAISYDLVLTDIQLPKMNGIHFMEILKQHENYNNQPIIAMTGRLNLSKQDYVDSGFSGLLAKPFQTVELQDMLHQFFDSDSVASSSILPDNVVNKENKEFSLRSLKMFLADEEAIHKTLLVFLEETKKNSLLLKEAKQNDDIPTINAMSHKMLGMFKQLEVVKVIPFLEQFETANDIEELSYTNFTKQLDSFIALLEGHLN